MTKQFPLPVLVAIVFLLGIVNAAALYWHLYFYIWWLDIPMHMIGGFWIGLSALVLYYNSNVFRNKDRTTSFVLIVSVATAMIIGVGWEAFEVSVDRLNGLTNFDLVDTLSDICNDFIGAGLAAVIFLTGRYNRKI